jgi:thiol-disulfide isomerase/thioredoxin
MKTHPVRLVALVAAALASVLTLSACSGGSNAVDQSAGSQFRFVNATRPGETIAVGDRKPAGDVAGPLLDGKGQYELTADKGKVVVINLWGSWCPPCRVETPQFDALYRSMKGEAVNFVGFDVKESAKGDGLAFVTDNKISYPIVWDQKGQIALQLGNLPLVGLPDTVVMDRQGRVAAVYVGEVQPADLKPVLTKLLAES